MTEYAKLYYDVVISQIQLAKERLTKEEFAEFIEELDDQVGTEYETAKDNCEDTEHEG